MCDFTTHVSISGFWAHEDSPLIHPVGWAKRVGHELEAPHGYVDRWVVETCHDGVELVKSVE